jgi:UDP-4-amino-4,6-dideoxy-N-acetyl-beta-L-altrosamine N-acetyltransferase
MMHKDLEQVLFWRNHPEIRRYMYTQHEIGLDEHRVWFEAASKDNDRNLLIFELKNQAMGFVQFNIHSSGLIADWGFYIAPGSKRGTGRLLGKTALSHAFKQLELHKLCGQAVEFNERSIKFHRQLDFKQEGVLRDQHFDGDSYHAVICFGLLHQEWQLSLRDINE